MGKNSYFFRIFLLLFVGLALVSCNKTHLPEISLIKRTNLKIGFLHKIHGEDLVFDSLMYTNSLGQHYLINDLQYFISGIAFHSKDGFWFEIPEANGIRYVDAKDASNRSWNIKEILDPAIYDSIRFVVGLDQAANYSNRFIDPPERDMFWPEILGGGYHYLKMNLKWKTDPMPEMMPFMFHLGIGQMYSGQTANPDSIIGFIQNCFSVKSAVLLNLSENSTDSIGIIMNIERWFDGDNAFNFSSYPMGIMQNQQGMYLACRNGRNVFSVIHPVIKKMGR